MIYLFNWIFNAFILNYQYNYFLLFSISLFQEQNTFLDQVIKRWEISGPKMFFIFLGFPLCSIIVIIVTMITIIMFLRYPII